jgi:hypothetical protein
MTQILDQKNMDFLQTILDSAGPDGLYAVMAGLGYQYAKLAEGVALGNSLAGAAAINFMNLTAQKAGHPLSPEKLKKIRHDMAQGYLSALAAQLKEDDSKIRRDVDAAEAWGFHNAVFTENQMDPDSWTLNSVFKALDEVNRETYWQLVTSSAGKSFAEAELAFQTHRMMALAVAIGTSQIRQDSENWLARVEHYSTATAVAEMLAANLGKTLSDFSFSELFSLTPVVIEEKKVPLPPDSPDAQVGGGGGSAGFENLGGSAGTHIPTQSSGAHVDIGPLELPNNPAGPDSCPKEFRHGEECDWDPVHGAADYLSK